jgi:hypothetical protein
VDGQAATAVIAFLREIYHSHLIKIEYEKGERLLFERLKAEPKYSTGVPSDILRQHVINAGFKPLSESVNWITAAVIHALASGTVFTDVALLEREPMPGMFPSHPAVRRSSKRHFAVIKLPFTPYRGTGTAEYEEFFSPRGRLDLRGMVIEKISPLHRDPIIRLHLSVYDGVLRWYSIDSTGIMKMSPYGSAVGMTSFIDMGLFFATQPGSEERDAYDSLDWCIAVERGELIGKLDDEPFCLVPRWLPELETVIRDTVNLNK